jgi:hypothetical protein
VEQQNRAGEKIRIIENEIEELQVRLQLEQDELESMKREVYPPVEYIPLPEY